MNLRLALAPFPLLAAVIGLGYLLGDPMRTATPSFEVAKSLARPVAAGDLTAMQLWGLVFLIGAVALTAGLIATDTHVLYVALMIGAGIYLWWAIVLGAAAFSGGSANAWAVFLFVSVTHYVAADRLRTKP